LEITRGEFLTIRSREFEVGFRADPGHLPQLWAATSDDLRRRFEEADAAGDGFVDAEKLAPFPNLTTVRRLLGLADSNGDGKLQTAELADWVSVQDKFVAAQSLVSIMDFGRGLFEFIDVNYDGLLSVPELEQSWPKLKAIGVIGPDGFNAGKLPRQLRLTISPGTPRTNLAGRTSAGPAWFQNMDRNGDGNVSSGEFLGPPSARSASAFAKWANHHIGRLQIAMNNPLGVRKTDSLGNLFKNADEMRQVFAEISPGGERFMQRLAANQLHRQEGRTIRQGSQGIDRRDSRVLEPGRHSCFDHKS
jgi:Ca2+-binding EF-hand superfamily protein